jgi:hypothetical protein
MTVILGATTLFYRRNYSSMERAVREEKYEDLLAIKAF